MNEAPRPQQLMEVIKSTPPLRIAELDLVKSKFVQNYNYTHPEKVGELMYHKQLIYFKQLIAESSGLQGVDPFSLYACFVTAGVHGYSFDPADNEIYMVPLKGKAVLWRQAGAHVKRLIRTNQIMYADQPKLVYEGDTFEVRSGRVVNHVEKYGSETLVAGYVRFVLTEAGDDRFFIYRRSDWESWKKKSTSTKVDNPWASGINGQPDPGFLRTKLIKHACTEKSWAIGHTSVLTETFTDVEYDEMPEEVEVPKTSAPTNGHAAKKPEAKKDISDDDAFVVEEIKEPAVVHADADDEF